MNNDIINEHVDFSYKNKTAIDPFLAEVSQVTFNSNYLPIISANALKVMTDKITISSYPDYITALISVYHAGSLSYKIPLLFPTELSESLSANFVKENAVGSTYPIAAFSNSGPRQINLEFVALSDYLPTGFSFDEYLQAIRMMTRPKVNGSYVQGPEVQVTLANISFTGICESVSISYDNLFGNQTYQKANVSCQFTVTKD